MTELKAATNPASAVALADDSAAAVSANDFNPPISRAVTVASARIVSYFGEPDVSRMAPKYLCVQPTE